MQITTQVCQSVYTSHGEYVKKHFFFYPRAQKLNNCFFENLFICKAVVMYMSIFMLCRHVCNNIYTFQYITPNIPGTFCPYRNVHTDLPGHFVPSRNMHVPRRSDCIS
jgi:hypothetical protein